MGIRSRRIRSRTRGGFELDQHAPTAAIPSNFALAAGNCSPGYTFIPRSNNHHHTRTWKAVVMDSIIYLVGVVVVIMLVLSFLGLR